MVTTVARGIDAHLVVHEFQSELTFLRGEFHPGNIREIALEFGIFPRLSGNGVVIVVAPQANLRTFHAVLPDAIGTFSYPLLTLHHLLGIVETDAQQVNHAVEIVIYIHVRPAVAEKTPGNRLDRTVTVVGHQSAVTNGETIENSLVAILGIVGLLLEGLLVIVVIESVLRTV